MNNKKTTLFMDWELGFTSVPMRVGLMYREALGELGTQSFSMLTNFLMHSISSSPSNV